MDENTGNASEPYHASDCTGCEKATCTRSNQSKTHRRTLLGLLAGGASASLAGCANLYAFGAETETRERPDLGGEDEEDGQDEQDGEDGGADGGEDGEQDGGDDVETFDIHYVKQGETIEVPADKSLLVAGEEQGWDLPFNCRQGFCGECTARLWGNTTERVQLEGNQFLEEDELRDGFTLTCVGFPRSDFALETGKKEDLENRPE